MIKLIAKILLALHSYQSYGAKFMFLFVGTDMSYLQWYKKNTGKSKVIV